jgi:hypothetical protein
MTNFNDNWDKEGKCFSTPITNQEKKRFKIGFFILIAGLMGYLGAGILYGVSENSSLYLTGAIMTALLSSFLTLAGLHRMFRHSLWIEYNP